MILDTKNIDAHTHLRAGKDRREIISVFLYVNNGNSGINISEPTTSEIYKPPIR